MAGKYRTLSEASAVIQRLEAKVAENEQGRAALLRRNQALRDEFFLNGGGALAIDVRTFGAKGDGVTDDTAAIQAARDAAGAKTVSFPAGTYLVTDIRNTVAGQKWLLDAGATIKLADGSDTHTLWLTGEGSSIEGGAIDGNKANQTANGHGIVITGSRCTVRGVRVENTRRYGIYALDADRITIAECDVIDSGETGITVEASAGSDRYKSRVFDNHIDRSSLGSGVVGGGIKINGNEAGINTERVIIRGNQVDMPSSPVSGAANCIELWGGGGRAAISDNITNGGSMGVSVDSGHHTAVAGNTFVGPSSYGMEVARCSYVTLTGNVVDGQGLATRGVLISNTSPGRISVAGNIIDNLAASSRGIFATNTPSYLSIVGNTIELDATGYGIELSGATHAAISGNNIHGGGVAQKAIALTNCAGVAVSGNACHNFTENGVLIIASSGTSDNIAIAGNTMVSCGNPVTTQISGGSIGTHVRWDSNAPNVIDMISATQNIQRRSGFGSPESAITAGIGSIYQQRDGGTSTTLWVKESGTGSSGWVAK
jgi:polygalacturonase